MEREDLFNHLKNTSKVLEAPGLEEAFKAVDRADFVGADYLPEAYEDYALPIGHDATISQPTTVAFMLELLGAMPGERVLDVGSGSGYTAALLGEIVGREGRVIGVEIIPELVALGKTNVQKYNVGNIEIKEAEKEIEDDEREPFERILVSASSAEIPEELLHQLALGGVMVIPIGESIVKVMKTEENEIETEEFPGFSFVPLK